MMSPDGPDSAKAWRMVAVAFVAGFVVFGVVYSFGVFLQPMAMEFGASGVATSAIYSIASVIWYMLGPVTGHLSDRFGPRIIVGTGAAAMGIGLASTAIIDHLWIGYLTYGLGVGIGAACAYVPTLASLGGWFTHKRNVAFGIAAAGTGCGMLVVPPLSAVLIGAFGWRDANLVLGGGGFFLLAACALLAAAPPQAPQASTKRRLRPVLLSFEFVMMYLSWVLATTALFVSFIFLPQFAVAQGAELVAGSVLISILGAASILGRLGIGILGRWWSDITLFKIAVLTMGASNILWLVLPEYQWLMLFAIILGLAYGLRIALVPSVLIGFFGPRDLGVILGIFFTATGFAAILGPMAASFVVEAFGGYQWGIGFAAATGFLGFLAIAFLGKNAYVENDQ
tara:strand:+ start:782 stop:1972 length:1191 start_codon:yes stop_codon:yes gene_type:complete